MKLSEIRNFPTTIDTGTNGQRFHESLLRSYHIVQKVIELCERRADHEVIMELIEDMRSAPQTDYDGSERQDSSAVRPSAFKKTDDAAF